MSRRGTDGKYWTPTIPGCVCQHCGVTYTAHKYNQKYCGKSCSATATAKRVEHTERTCPGCETKWGAPPSNPSHYCSKQCIFDSGEWERPKDAECETCGTAFKSRRRRTRGEWERFCSNACAGKSLTVGRVDKVCAQCGKAFQVYELRANEATCSWACAHAYYVRDRSPAWKGGLVAQNERPSRRRDRDGYQAKYEGEHRLIAAREIGRDLVRGEVLVTLDRNNLNLDPDNLFLCPSMSEWGLIAAGAVEWPSGSNLKAYREQGYERPNVILTVHEWERGRRPGKGGKWIKRHPQADEIIKRRRAGASIRTLAKDFGTVLSTWPKP